MYEINEISKGEIHLVVQCCLFYLFICNCNITQSETCTKVNLHVNVYTCTLTAIIHYIKWK